MLQRIRCELRVFKQYPGVLAGIAFLSTFGGILLWVNGTTAPLIFRITNIPSFAPGFTVTFLLWLLLYALAGLQFGCILVYPMFGKCYPFKNACLAVLVYTLLMAWYPLFFSVVHVFFAAAVLVLAICLQIYMSILLYGRVFIIFLLAILQIFVEMYFVFISVAYMFLN